MSKKSDSKRKSILEVAKKRFAHFGMNKTTMAEIAKDLSISKALLYYYYPDKNSLYAAVLGYVMNEMIDASNDLIDTTEDSEAVFLAIIQSRTDFLTEYYNLFEYSYNMRKDAPAELEKAVRKFFEKEIQQFATILKRGKLNGELHFENADTTARLLFFSLVGMRFGILKEMGTPLFPTPEEFSLVMEMQQKMVRIFVRGLKANG